MKLHLTSFLVVFACLPWLSSCGNEEDRDHPKVLDERLTLTLFAEDPDIVTPIGIASDSAGRIFVLESHTHTPPRDYHGPDGDRIIIFVDEDNDGIHDKSSVYAEGFKEGVNIAFAPSGKLYVVTSKAVFALHDHDADGKSDAHETVVELTKPEKVYAHAALLGIAFSSDGWMYISRGNTGGAAWTLRGSDGSEISGYGDGGNVMRARADGSNLHEVATGFWNPIDLKFDHEGRLLAVDNDPDSRGPNRLVHVVEGGDYGYQSLYGESGVHPYLAWNGELPGTLPFAAPLGEAPSGLLSTAGTSLPGDYQDNVLSSIWEESRVVRIKLKQRGLSVHGTSEVIIEGGPEFRPVTFTSTPEGSIYFTDWVLRNYPNHGRGRIWKLSSKSGIQTTAQLSYDEEIETTPGPRLETFDDLRTALADKDPFLRHEAVMRLARKELSEERLRAVSDNNAAVRIGGMVAMQRAAYTPKKDLLQRLLKDSVEEVRRQALRWIGQAGLVDASDHLREALVAGPASAETFDTYLETVRHLQPAFISAVDSQSEAYSKSISRPLPPDFFEHLLRDKHLPPHLVALTILRLEHNDVNVARIMSLLKESDEADIQMSAVQALAKARGDQVTQMLMTIATDDTRSDQLRAEAILSLSWHSINLSSALAPLLNDGSEDVRLETARYIRTRSGTAEAIDLLNGIDSKDARLQEQLALVKRSKGAKPDVENKEARDGGHANFALKNGGNFERGRRAFFSPSSMCSSCHAVNGRGGDLGPDLTNVGRSKNRQQLLTSILKPSAEISPEYQGWFIKLTSGEVVQGRQIDIGEKSIDLYTHASGFVSFSKDDIADYGMIDASLMPEGFGRSLTEGDLHDIIVFLQER